MYWQDRMANSQAKLTNKSIKDTEKQLIKYYSKTMKTVIDDFELTYHKLLTTVGEGREPTPADLYKLDKYWQLQAQLKTELTKLGDKQAALLSRQFTEQYIGIYNTMALPDVEGMFSYIDKKTAQQMINSIWCADGKSWSDRIWTNTDKLQQALNDNLIDCVVSGKKATQLKDMLQRDFNVSYNRADSIVRTEMAHIQTQAAQQRYKDNGIQQIEIWADEDERRCEICGKLHTTKYPVGGAIPIPAHPRCRCCIVPVID